MKVLTGVSEFEKGVGVGREIFPDMKINITFVLFRKDKDKTEVLWEWS